MSILSSVSTVLSFTNTNVTRLSPSQIQKLLNQYLVADYEQPINGEIMKAVASRVTEKSDVLLLQAVDMEDSGPYEIAEPRSITALETYTPSCKYSLVTGVSFFHHANSQLQGCKLPASRDWRRLSQHKLLPSKRSLSTSMAMAMTGQKA